MSLNLPINYNEEIVCPHCNKKVNVNFQIQDLEFVSSDDDRGMGSEVEYSFTEEAKCPNCGKDIEIEGSVWEYPVGAVNLIQLV